MFAPRTLRRILLATSMLVAFPMLLTTVGCGRARDASDYDDDDEDDRPRKKHKKPTREDDTDQNEGGDGDRSSSRRGSGTWYCAPSDVTACFDTPDKCADRANYLPNKPQCERARAAYCYTHDLYLDATFACFATMGDCSGDQNIAKTQERNNAGTYHHVSKCQKW